MKRGSLHVSLGHVHNWEVCEFVTYTWYQPLRKNSYYHPSRFLPSCGITALESFRNLKNITSGRVVVAHFGWRRLKLCVRSVYLVSGTPNSSSTQQRRNSSPSSVHSVGSDIAFFVPGCRHPRKFKLTSHGVEPWWHILIGGV